MLDGLANADVSAAAADVARHRSVDILVTWMRIGVEQRGGGDDLPGLAISTLNDLAVQPRLLNAYPVGQGRDGLDRRDRLAAYGCDLQYARPHWLTVQQHGASTALGDTAAKLGSSHAQH